MFKNKSQSVSRTVKNMTLKSSLVHLLYITGVNKFIRQPLSVRFMSQLLQLITIGNYPDNFFYVSVMVNPSMSTSFLIENRIFNGNNYCYP